METEIKKKEQTMQYLLVMMTIKFQDMLFAEQLIKKDL